MFLFTLILDERTHAVAFRTTGRGATVPLCSLTIIIKPVHLVASIYRISHLTKTSRGANFFRACFTNNNAFLVFQVRRYVSNFIDQSFRQIRFTNLTVCDLQILTKKIIFLRVVFFVSRHRRSHFLSKLVRNFAHFSANIDF